MHGIAQCLEELIVAGHVMADAPAGAGLPEHTFLVQPGRGAGMGLWLAVNWCTSPWFVWLADDHTYVQRDWLVQADRLRQACPKMKVMQFAGAEYPNCVQIGMADRAWYLDHWPLPVYGHYCWDDEMHDWAKAEGVLLVTDQVRIQDGPDSKNENSAMYAKDRPILDARRGTARMVDGRMTCDPDILSR